MRVGFLFEFKNIVGGVTSLLITVIRELRKRNIEVVLFNFKDGIISKELSKEGVTLTIIDLEENRHADLGTHVRSTDLFVIFSFKEVFRHFFDANPRLLYYNINAFLAEIGKYKFGIHPKKYSRRLLQELIEKNSLVLMDDTGILNVSDKLGMSLRNPQFLPIPISAPSSNGYIENKERKARLRLTYIGRAVDWKIYPLKKLLQDVSAIQTTELSVHFTIVVDSIDNLKKIVDPLEYATDRLKVDLLESIPPSEINELLRTRSDISFGMGTAALDSAKLGIPTILMDFGHSDFPENYMYSWLYNTKSFNLGKDITEKYEQPEGAMSMKELLSNSITEEDYLYKQSELCFNYVSTNHSVTKMVDSLLDYLAKAEFRFRDAKPYVLYYSRLHSLLRTISGKN